jgi:hypothetical protein
MAGPAIPRPGEIDTENIIRPAYGDLSEDRCQLFEEIKAKRQEEINVLRKQQEEELKTRLEELQSKNEEEDLEAFMVTFKKDRQGAITSTGEARLTPL